MQALNGKEIVNEAPGRAKTRRRKGDRMPPSCGAGQSRLRAKLPRECRVRILVQLGAGFQPE